MCAAGDKQWTQQHCPLTFYQARKKRKKRSPKATNSSRSQSAGTFTLPFLPPQQHRGNPPPPIHSQPKHYLTTSPFYSENPWGEESMAFSNKLSMSNSLLASDPAAISVTVCLFIQRMTNTHTCNFVALSLWKQTFNSFASEAQSSIHPPSMFQKSPLKTTMQTYALSSLSSIISSLCFKLLSSH